MVISEDMMRPALSLSIEPLAGPGCDEFFLYLNDHRSENGGEETGYFLPISRAESLLPYDKEKAFRDGLLISVGLPGWRRAWLARDSGSPIVGHIDLRAHGERFAEHRCLLGIGVHRHHRRLGIGVALLAHAIQWALKETDIAWLDLQVLSTNLPAIRHYQRAQFVQVGEVPEMFRLDGRSFGLILMTKRLRP